MGWNEFILKLLSILLSWQVIGGIIILTFGIYFHNEIRSILLSIDKIKFNSNEITLHKDPTQQRVNEKRTDNMSDLIKSDPKQILKEYNLLLEKFTFENIFNNIYGSQLKFLLELNVYPDIGLSHIQAESFYIQFYNSLPSTYQMSANRNFYFNWLQHIKLIKDDGSKYFITDYGKKFLAYIKQTNLISLYRIY